MAVPTNEFPGTIVANMAPFSYAQAAKGQSIPSTQAQLQSNKADSSAATSSKNMSPKSTPMSPIDRSTNWADEQGDIPPNSETLSDQAEAKVPEVKINQPDTGTRQVNGILPHSAESAILSPKIATPLTSNNNKEDESSSGLNASSESAWGNGSQVSDPVETVTELVDDGSDAQKKDESQQIKESKPLKEAPPPPVNIWQQRAQEAKTKHTPASNPSKITNSISNGKSSDPGLKSAIPKIDESSHKSAETSNTSNQWNGQEKASRQGSSLVTRKTTDLDTSRTNQEDRSSKQQTSDSKPGNEQRQNEAKTKQTSKSESITARASIPPSGDTKSWPTPENAQDEERRRAQNKSDKTEKDASPAAPSKSHGKSWVSIPFTPTVKFNTPLPGTNRRGGGRTNTRSGRDTNKGVNSGPSGSGKPVATIPATNESSENQQRGRGEPKSSRASSLPPKSRSDGSSGHSSQSDNLKRSQDISQSKSTALQDISDKRQAGVPQDLPQHAIPGYQTSNNPTGSVAPTVLGISVEDRTPGPSQSLNGSSEASGIQKPNHAQGDFQNDVPSSSRTRWRNSYHAEGPGQSVDESSDRRRSVADVGAVNFKNGWGSRRSEESGRSYDTYQRGEPRPERGRGGTRNGRAGSQYGNNLHHTTAPQLPNGHLPPIQTNTFPSKPPSSYQGPQNPQSSQFSSGSRGYRSGPRSQSIPTETQYARYPAPFPNMMPLQPQPYMTSPYDISPMQPPMSAGMPYGPYMDQYQLIGMVSFQLEYYFSTDNLLKDMFLRKQMDSQGYVFLSVVAGFNRIKSLTTDLELIKFVCLTSQNIDIRVGSDGRDRLRKSEGWEQFVLDMAERDPSAQNDGPLHVEPPISPYPQIFETSMMARPTMQPPDMPHSASAAFPHFSPPPSQFNPLPIASPVNGLPNLSQNTPRYPMSPTDPDSTSRIPQHPFSDVPTRRSEDEPDSFADEQIDVLTVVVKNVSERPQRSPHHSAASRTFSDGSIDGSTMIDELSNHDERQSRSLNKPNGPIDGDSVRKLSAIRSPVPSKSPENLDLKNPFKLFWVKQPASGNDVPADCKFEQYTFLRAKALDQRRNTSPGDCPYDMDVLFQFWSHFLIRNFNTQMYNEFRTLAFQDAQQNNSNVGINNLIKFYGESLSSQQPIRNRIARHYVELVKSEGLSGERPAFEQLRQAWRNGALNMKNRKKISDYVDAELNAELDR